MKRRVLTGGSAAVLGCLTLVVTAGCSQESREARTSDLVGRDFVATWAPIPIKPSNDTLWLSFPTAAGKESSPARFSSAVGCNAFGYHYKLSEGKLEIIDQSSGLVGCAPPLMAQEMWWNRFLLDSPSITVAQDGRTLVLGGRLGRVTFKRATKSALPDSLPADLG